MPRVLFFHIFSRALIKFDPITLILQSMKAMSSNSTFVGPVLAYQDIYFHMVTNSDPTRLAIGYDELAGFILEQVS
jgi:hypothetical protein